MKKAFLYGWLLICLLFTGCATDGTADSEENAKRPEGEPGITGYVMSAEGQRILVVSTQAEDFSSTGGLNEFYDAIYFSNVPEGIMVGDKVNVWYNIVADSYPGQSSALYVEVIDVEKPQGAVHTEGEALAKALDLAKALASNELGTQGEFGDVFAVKTITYNPQAGGWDVQLKGIFSDQLYDVHVQEE